MRIIPRLVVFGYLWLAWDTHVWYKGLEIPITTQQMYAMAIVGIAPLVFGFYKGNIQFGGKATQDDQ